MFYMHPRNREILAPMIRAYGNKDREQTEKSRRIDNSRRDQSARPPRQVLLLDKQLRRYLAYCNPASNVR
jgi:hypothetical protein